MPKYKLDRPVKAHADVVWAVISDLEAFGEVAPNVRKIEILEGASSTAVRRCYDHQDKTWTERCVDWEEGQEYTMEVIASDFDLIRSMRFTFGLVQREDDVLVKMYYRYRPRFWLFGRIADLIYIRRVIARIAHAIMDNWVARIHDREWGYQITVDTILRRKGRGVITVNPDESLMEVAKLLREKRIGCVIVAETDEEVVGIASERDVVRGIAISGNEALSLPISEVMTRKLVVCAPDNDMFFVMACMTDRRIRHLPIMEDGKLVGIISIGDVVKERIHSLESESETMREYIAGREWRYHHHHATGVHDVADLRGDVTHAPSPKVP